MPQRFGFHMAPFRSATHRAVEPEGVLADLAEAIEESGVAKAEIARRVRKPSGGHYSGQWLGQALKGGLSLRDAGQVAQAIGYSLQLVRPGDAVDDFRRALRANRLDANVTRVLWTAFKEAKHGAIGQERQRRPKKREAVASR